MENANIGLGDAMILGQGGCGNQFVWLIILIALMGGGFGGWNNRDTNVARIQDVYASNDNQSLNGNIRDLNNGLFRLGNGIADATFALNNSVMNGFNSTQRDIMQGNCMLDKSIAQGTYVIDKAITDNRYVLGNAINDGRFAMQGGFNGVERNVDAVRYDGAMNTCKITTNATENTQRILDKLNAMEFNAQKAENENLRQALAQANLTVSQFAQNQYLVNAIAPNPKPAYVVPSPFVTNAGCCGCMG